jgi:hypothetical protein
MAMCIGGDIAAEFAECVLLVYVAVCSKPDKGLEQTRDFAFLTVLLRKNQSVRTEMLSSGKLT